MELTITDLSHARSLYNAGRITEMYDYLSDRGDRYAELANGVARGDTFAGLMALEHLENAATENGGVWTSLDVQNV